MDTKDLREEEQPIESRGFIHRIKPDKKSSCDEAGVERFADVSAIARDCCKLRLLRKSLLYDSARLRAFGSFKSLHTHKKNYIHSKKTTVGSSFLSGWGGEI